MIPYRRTIVLLVLALLASACGARIDDDRLDAARRGALEIGEAPGGGTTGAGSGTTTGTATTGGTTSPDDATTGATAETTGGGATSGSTATTGAGTTGGSTTGGDDGDGATAGGTSGGTTGDTRAAPPGGNGGATEVGVTADTIVLSNISDLSGAVPGLFEDAQLAVRARLAKFANEEGTIYGRKIALKARDSKMDSGANRAQYQAACADSLMAVGSMSAFDSGIKGPVEECGIPDLRTAGVSRPAMETQGSYSVDAMSSDKQPLAEYLYWKELVGADGVKKACYLWISAETTTFQTALVRAGTEQIGYEWVIEQPIEISESNYAPYVLDMKNEGCVFVTFQGAYQQAYKLAEAMRQQSYWPEVYALQSNAYTPNYIALGPANVEDTHVAVPSVILEEIGQHPELQEYARWLDRIKPGAKPTGLGMYAWSAATLAIDLLKQVGPEVTRTKVQEAIKQVRDFDGNGLLPPQNIGQQINADCVIIVQVKSGAFQRIEPSQGMRCDNRVVDVQV